MDKVQSDIKRKMDKTKHQNTKQMIKIENEKMRMQKLFKRER